MSKNGKTTVCNYLSLQAAQIAITDTEGVFIHAGMNCEGHSLEDSSGAIHNLSEKVVFSQKTFDDV